MSTVEAVAPNIYEVTAEQLSPQPDPAFIEVTGNATVEIPTDQAQVVFAMETQSDEASEAASTNADAMAGVLAALRTGAFQGLDLETFGYALQPQYAVDNSRVRTIAGYVAVNNVRATIDDVDAVGRLIDVAVGAGANRVSSISFTASDPEPARAQALAEAVRSARAQAEVMAEALGYELGAPLEIRGGAQRPVPRVLDAVRTQAAAVSTPIEAGDQTVDASVTVRFALGPELAGP